MPKSLRWFCIRSFGRRSLFPLRCNFSHVAVFGNTTLVEDTFLFQTSDTRSRCYRPIWPLWNGASPNTHLCERCHCVSVRGFTACDIMATLLIAIASLVSVPLVPTAKITGFGLIHETQRTTLESLLQFEPSNHNGWTRLPFFPLLVCVCVWSCVYTVS